MDQLAGPEQRLEIAATSSGEDATALLRWLPGTMLVSSTGQILAAHASLQTMLGYAVAELEGQVFWEQLPHGEDRPALQTWWSAVVATETPTPHVARLRHQNGTWVDTEITSIRLSESWVLLLRDVTAQQRQARLFQRSQERLRTFLELSTEGIWCFELDRPVPTSLPPEEQIGMFFQHAFLTECNDAVARMFGYERGEEIIGRRLDAFMPPENPQNRAFLEAFITSGYQLWDAESHERAKEDKPVYFLNSLIGYVEDGALRRAWGTQRDITPRKLMEEELRASESRYRQLVENLEQSIFLKDAQYRYVAVNRRFCLNLERTEDSILGKTDHDLFPKHLADKYRADDEIVLSQGRRLELEETALIQGRPRTVRVVKSPVQDGLGRTTGVLSIFWDVSEQRALEAHLRHAQKMDAIGQLAQGVAHDFNNMLTGILGNLDLALRNLKPDDPNRDLLETAERATQRTGTLVRRLMNFSQRRKLRLESLKLSECLQEAIELLRHTLDPRVELVLRYPMGTWQVLGDRDQLNQVVMNLGLNARDAMPEGGTLTITATNVLVTEEYARRNMRARPGEFVSLKVTDSGCGIPEELRPRLFEPFFTTKGADKGLGLGLALAFGIVEQHRGWIDYESTVGKGSTFTIYLPRDVSPLLQRTAPAVTSSGSRGHETVLLAEDEAILRQLGGTILERYGYRVQLAEDGQQAVDLFRQINGRVDLVILDLSMPRLSGRETCEKLREMKPDVRIMFTSGFTDELQAMAEEGDAHGYLGKPYRPEELATAVRAALDGQTARMMR